MSRSLSNFLEPSIIKIAVSAFLSAFFCWHESAMDKFRKLIADMEYCKVRSTFSLSQTLPGDQTGKIQPGTAVKLVVTVENKGQQESPAGQLYVRYAFAHPLENEAASVIFETEKKPLPAIEPGKKAEIVFDTPHQIPSLLDFVRHDWSIREYQAIALSTIREYHRYLGNYLFRLLLSRNKKRIPGENLSLRTLL